VLIDCLWTQQSGFALSEQCGIKHTGNLTRPGQHVPGQESTWHDS
jgi:hypothetical protein